MDVEQNKLLEIEWKHFKEECQQKIDELKKKQKVLEVAYEKSSTERIRLVIQASQQGQFIQPIPGYAAKAIKKLGPGINDVNGNMSFVFTRALEPVVRAALAAGEYEKILDKKQELLNKKYEDQIGEGRPNPLEAICKDENAIRTEFLKNATSPEKCPISDVCSPIRYTVSPTRALTCLQNRKALAGFR